jgi:hypothetical protein
LLGKYYLAILDEVSKRGAGSLFDFVLNRDEESKHEPVCHESVELEFSFVEGHHEQSAEIEDCFKNDGAFSWRHQSFSLPAGDLVAVILNELVSVSEAADEEGGDGGCQGGQQRVSYVPTGDFAILLR